MAVIRRTEKAAHDLFLAGPVKGTAHLAAGREAVAVGASAALDAPIKRVAAACVPLPFADALEDLVIPTTDSVAETVRKLAAY